ncbi:MAG TPA: class I SAM-dependent methyltransferase [Thermoguttaceae bacterium]|nr:class I SAM-dependent methyltransferase [Thermoguttaceae bacterium]
MSSTTHDNFRYDPATCDLCGSEEHEVLIDLRTGRAMYSDRRIVDADLKKLTCKRCGLVRSGEAPPSLEEHYAENYTLNTEAEDQPFYTGQGSISRSEVICDWLISSMGPHRWQSGMRCLEIGSGSGMILREFIKRFPEVDFEGIELNRHAVALARQQELPVRRSTLGDFQGGPYDTVFAVAVLEHVPSPSGFLREIHDRLRPGGLLFLCQPTQEVESHDVLFADHLHHFGTEHLRQYARKCGFRELGSVVGHRWIPTFSVHLWEAAQPDDAFAWIGPPGYTACASSISGLLADLRRLDETLAGLQSRQRPVAVFGLNEFYALARTYSRLGGFPIVCGLDDSPQRPELAQWGFPVVAPERCPEFSVRDVILTMNKIYYPQVRCRLEKLGLVVHPVWR